MQAGYEKSRFSTNISLYLGNDTTAIVECEYETVPKLSNGTIFSDLEWRLTHPLRSRYYLRLNISETVRDTHSYSGVLIVHTPRSRVISNDLDWPWMTDGNIQWHEASRGFSATAELLVQTVMTMLCVCAVGTGITADSVLRQHRRLSRLFLRSPRLVVRRRRYALAARDPPTVSVYSCRPCWHSVWPASCRAAGAGLRRVRRLCRGAGWSCRRRCLSAVFLDASARRQRRLRRGDRSVASTPRTCRRQCARALQTHSERPAAPLNARRKLSPDVQSNDQWRFRFAACCSGE